MSLGISTFVVRTLRQRRINKAIDEVIRDSTLPLCPRCVQYATMATRASIINWAIYFAAVIAGVVIGIAIGAR